MTIRRASVAGMFYPSDADTLRKDLAKFIPDSPRKRALAVVVPHAGYPYSGRVAGAAYGRVEIPRTVVILCFNHRSQGADIAVFAEGAWRTPLGEVPIAEDLARKLRKAFPQAIEDEVGHHGEHSGEVQVPFLKYLRPDVRILPVALSLGIDEYATNRLKAFGESLAGLIQDELVVCSTDLNHYEDQEKTLAKDQKIIDAVEKLDIAALRQAMFDHKISMCGFAPTIATIAYARAKGATSAETVLHRTSGDASGEFNRVVGYVGMTICGN